MFHQQTGTLQVPPGKLQRSSRHHFRSQNILHFHNILVIFICRNAENIFVFFLRIGSADNRRKLYEPPPRKPWLTVYRGPPVYRIIQMQVFASLAFRNLGVRRNFPHRFARYLESSEFISPLFSYLSWVGAQLSALVSSNSVVRLSRTKAGKVFEVENFWSPK